jgi:hypothetical protein
MINYYTPPLRGIFFIAFLFRTKEKARTVKWEISARMNPIDPIDAHWNERNLTRAKFHFI